MSSSKPDHDKKSSKTKTTSDDIHTNDDVPLPAGWSRLYSKSNQKFYYYHKNTNVTQWHYPTMSEVNDPNIAKKRVEEAKEREEKKRAHSESSNGTQAQADVSASKRSGNDSTTSVREEASFKSFTNATTTTTTNSVAKRQRTETTIAAAPTTTISNSLELADKTCVAIIVPYRDIHVSQQRAAHLQQFIPHMIQFLNRCKYELQYISDYHIYIIEQSSTDQLKFNRGKLLNIGYDIARKNKNLHHDVYIFHDVDLLPDHDLAMWYCKFPKVPIHIARVWDRYSNNPKYFGGVVSFSSSDYKRINGYPNNYFGWGGEDDEMQRRLERLGIKFVAPDRGKLYDLERMSINEKMNFLKQNQEWKCMVKWELKDEHEATWQTNGLHDLKYKVLSQVSLDKEKNKASKITVDVKLNGNHWTNEKAGIDYIDTSWKK